MSNLANPKGDEFITHTGPELRFIFKKLLYFAILLPSKYQQHARSTLEGATRNRRRSNSSSSSSNSDDDVQDTWDKTKANEVRAMIDEGESFLNSFYRDCFAELVFPFGHSHMRIEKFVEVLSRENFSWVFDPEQLRGRFMNMARAPVVREAVDDLSTQVRNARHVVEQENRITSNRVTRRASSSSSRSNSGKRRGLEHISHRVDADSQDGRHT